MSRGRHPIDQVLDAGMQNAIRRLVVFLTIRHEGDSVPAQRTPSTSWYNIVHIIVEVILHVPQCIVEEDLNTFVHCSKGNVGEGIRSWKAPCTTAAVTAIATHLKLISGFDVRIGPSDYVLRLAFGGLAHML